MEEFKRGTLRSGSKTGPKVKSRKQAVAIGLNEARKAGQRVASPARAGAVARRAESTERRRRLAETQI